MKTHLHIYLDETGTFDKGDERCAIGGFSTPDPPTLDEMDAFWRAVLGELPDTFHATEQRDDAFAPVIARVLDEMARRGWTPVIFEHVTRAWIVDNATTYAYVMAEGLVRLGRLASHDATPPAELRVHAAWRTLPSADGSHLHRMQPDEYTTRINERIAFERVRASAHADELKWTWTIDFGSATRDRFLWLADALCSGWRRQYRLPSEVGCKVREKLAPHTFSVLQSDDEERVLLLLGRQEYGLAILDLLSLAQTQPTPRLQSIIRPRVIDRLVKLDARTLAAALTIPLFWGDENVEARAAQMAEKALRLYEEQILDELEKRLPASRRIEIDAIRAQAVVLALTSANHRGAVTWAESLLERLRPLRNRLSRYFEQLPVVIESHFHEAVHRTNIYDFETARVNMQHLGNELQGLVEIFETVIDEGHGDIRSDAVGRALGTALQAAFKSARRQPSLFAEARDLSDQALRQFAFETDRRRQLGYRCQLETDSGDLDAALQALRDLLSLDEAATLRQVVARAHDEGWFEVMHVARLWEAAARTAHGDLADGLQDAWAAAGLADHSHWNVPAPHPQGVILWKWGAALGYGGSLKRAIDRLTLAVRHLESEPDNVTLRTLALGARADRLAVMAEHEPNRCGSERNDFVAAWEKLVADAMPRSQRDWFSPWRRALDEIGRETDTTRQQKAWRRLAWEIPY